MEKNCRENSKDCFVARPLISVIVPVYNIENCIVRCVESLLLQTYKNIEIILVDDRLCFEWYDKKGLGKIVYWDYSEF